MDVLLYGQEFIPDLIIAPNAGIAAYKSWLPTIVCLFIFNYLYLCGMFMHLLFFFYY